MKCSRDRSAAVVTLFILFATLRALPASANYDLVITSADARASLLGLNREILEAQPTDSIDQSKLVEKAASILWSYRFESGADAPPMTIQNSPYLDFILAQKGESLFSSAFEAARKENHDKHVANVTAPVLFDDFMALIAQGEDKIPASLPKEVRDAANDIGSCIARKTQRVTQKSCPLQESGKIDEPGFLNLLMIKMTCRISVPSPCTVRKAIYAAAKKQLDKAVKDPAVKTALEGAFNDSFPAVFREQLMNQLNGLRANLPEFVSGKFKTRPSTEFWTEKAPLVEFDEHSTSQMTIKGAAAGLRADISTASVLANSVDPNFRGAAAALLYASANRILVLMGGTEAQWDGDHFKLADDERTLTWEDDTFVANRAAIQPNNIRKMPKLAIRQFGGWGLDLSPPRFAPWDPIGYDPVSRPDALRFFPSVFTLGARDVPVATDGSARETLSELAGLEWALSQFLNLTRPGTALGTYFGAESDMLKPPSESSVLFPREGRLLAVAMLTTVMKNLIAPQGHLELTEPGSSGLGLIFHDVLTSSGRSNAPVSIETLAQFLLASSEARQAILKDPDMPPELKTFGSQIDGALLATAWAMTMDTSMSPDGFFNNELGKPMTSGRSLSTQIKAMLALTRSYNDGITRFPAMLLNLSLAWKALDRYFDGRTVPWSIEPMASSHDIGNDTGISPALAWDIVELWSATQKFVKPDLLARTHSIDWGKWKLRMETIRAILLAQLEEPNGPGWLGE